MKSISYPKARHGTFQETLHGETLTDEFQWLEEGDAPEVVAWSDAQDAEARKLLDTLPGRGAIGKRLSALLQVDSISTPTRRGDRLFYSRRKANAEKRIFYWKEVDSPTEHLLLDPNTLSDDGSVSIGTVVPSWDGKWVAYSKNANNADQATLYVMDVASGKTSATDVIEGARYAYPSWLPNGRGFYYVGLPADGRSLEDSLPGMAEVRYHEMGTDSSKDLLIREATGDPKVFVSVSLSYDGKWLVYVQQRGWNATDLYYTKVADPKAPVKPKSLRWHPLVKGQPYLYDADVFNGYLYVTTNHEAPRWKVYRTPMKEGLSFEPKDTKVWSTVVEQPKEGSVLEGVQFGGDKMVVRTLTDVVGRLEVRDLDGSNPRPIDLGGLGAVGRVATHPEHSTFYYTYETILTPPTIYESDVKTLTKKVYFQLEVPIDPDLYEVKQVFYPSKDGTKIPMFIVAKKGMPKKGKPAPTILYGYGGFMVSLSPWFRPTVYPWLEAGGVYAIANIRGGGEYGTKWHDAGKGENKQTVFDDFEEAARTLINLGYASPKTLAIKGGSNGGLLVGAAMTQHPELYGAVVCAVPLLDMIRYTKYGAGITWVAEYGDPEKESDYKTLAAYSPYQHVKSGVSYPPLLMLSSAHDDRVDPMHARKFVARIQDRSQAKLPYLLRIERNAGHGGADKMSKTIEEVVDQYSFLLYTLKP